jgi:hypothetical protein
MRNEVAQQDHALERSRVSVETLLLSSFDAVSVDICIATRARALF